VERSSESEVRGPLSVSHGGFLGASFKCRLFPIGNLSNIEQLCRFQNAGLSRDPEFRGSQQI
jgi:hypothetical protein